TGLLVTIDEWVLRQAVDQAAAWKSELNGGDCIGIAMNISGRHLSDSHFASILADSIAAKGLPSGSLSIEVTERVLMEASNSSMNGLRAIRALGVDFALA